MLFGCGLTVTSVLSLFVVSPFGRRGWLLQVVRILAHWVVAPRLKTVKYAFAQNRTRKNAKMTMSAIVPCGTCGSFFMCGVSPFV
jgi:hypothetical protein